MSEQPKHIVGLSGGGDSSAMALLLAEREPREYEYICNSTGNELPDLFAHMRNLERLLGKPIRRVGLNVDLYGLIEQEGMLPNFRARFCTRMLKVEPTIDYIAAQPAGSVLYVGLLKGEEARTGIYGAGVTCRFPLQEWGMTKGDVRSYLRQREVSLPRRTDCAVCYHQRISEWRDLWALHPDEYARGEAIEAKMGATFRSPGRDTWPVRLADLRKEFERGRPIRPYTKKTEAEQCRVCSM